MQVQQLATRMILTCALSACAQSGSHQWVNQELLEKKTPQDRYVAMRRGDLSACRSDADHAAQRTGNGPECSSLKDAPNIFIAPQCLEQQSAVEQAAAQRTGNGPDCDSLKDAPNLFIAEQCLEQQSTAQQVAAQRTRTGPDCESLKEAPNIFIAQQCSEQQSTAQQAAAQRHRDALSACMARKGWVLEPVAK